MQPNAAVPGATGGSAACSRGRLHGKKLAVAHRNKAGRKQGISVHESDERSKLLDVRNGIVDDQQTSRAKNATQLLATNPDTPSAQNRGR